MPSPASTRIIIIDDHPIVRFGVETALAQLPGYAIIGQAATVEEALPLVESGQPDLLTLDLLLDGRVETGIIPRLKTLCPKMHILVFTMSDETVFAKGALAAGASGFLMKSDGLAELQNAAQQILAGELYCGKSKSPAPTERSRNENLFNRLSQREREVFERLGKGMTTSEIARELNLSVKTVATHRDNLKLKLNAATSTELVQKAVSCSFGRIV